jgi:hypothetical protein
MRRATIVLIGAAALILAATALASGVSVRKGLYAPLARWTSHHTSASVDLQVGPGGKMIDRHSGLSCSNNGNAPVSGSYSDIEFTTLLPHAIPISKSGHFAFSGTVTVSAYEDQTPYPITTHFAISGQFERGKLKPLKTIEVRGKVSSDYCSADTPKTFKLVFDPTG